MRWSKISGYFMIIFCSLMLLISIFLQVQIENYINTQNEKYSIINKMERISYKPAVIYYFQTRVLNNTYLDKQLANYIYQRKKLKSFNSTAYRDEYLIHCYFNVMQKKILIEEMNRNINNN